MRLEQLPYGMKDFKQLRLEGRFYADKTAYIRRLEENACFNFIVRPRRFGKSLFCETLRCYYEVGEKENFGRLFGDLAIGKNPTASANGCCVLTLDFSRVGSYARKDWADKFENYMADRLDEFVEEHWEVLAAAGDPERIMAKPLAASKYSAICSRVKRIGLLFYLIVDEYDNFTNEIAATLGKESYNSVTHGDGFYRYWFSLFKATCDRVFMAGVSPVTMDDLTSGFNIASNITDEASFNGMIGFTHEETRRLFVEFRGCGKYKDSPEVHLDTVRRWYDGYCFAEEHAGKETMYNCDMALHYLRSLVMNGEAPKDLIDANIRSDWNKLRTILRAQREAQDAFGVMPLTEELAAKGEVTFPKVRSFPFERIHEKENFKSLFLYYGIVTIGRVKRGDVYFRIPNECVRRQIFEHLREEYGRVPNAVDLTEFAGVFNDFAWEGKWKEFFGYLAEKYASMGAARDGIDGEARINGFVRSYLSVKNAFAVLPEMGHPLGFSDFALFPDRSLPPDSVPAHSYVIELKYSKEHATEEDLRQRHEEAVEQLTRYSKDPNLKKLAGGTPVHFLTVEFKGKSLVRLEEMNAHLPGLGGA